MNCRYCKGARSPCTCVSDCGARGEDDDKWCPQADGYIEYWCGRGYSVTEREDA